MIAYPDPHLSDDRVVLRRWSLDDLRCIEEASSDPVIPSGTSVPPVYSDAEGREFIERQWSRSENDEGISFAIHSRVADRAAGLVVVLLRPQPGVVGLGYWVVPGVRRTGCASSAARLVSSWAIGPAGYARVEAWVEPDNLASRCVLEKAGFEREGRLRAFLATGSIRSDADVYSRIAEDPQIGSVWPSR